MRRNRGFSIVESMVALVIVGAASVAFFKLINTSVKSVELAEKLSSAQRFEGLLRGQIVEAAREGLKLYPHATCLFVNTSTHGLLSQWHNLAPATGPKFSNPTGMSPINALYWINAAWRASNLSPPVDSSQSFAIDAFNRCALAVIDHLNGAPLPITCTNLMGFEGHVPGKEYKKYIVANLNAELYDFTSQQPVTCANYTNAISRGMRITYGLVWNTGTYLKPKPKGKSGVVEVIDVDM